MNHTKYGLKTLFLYNSRCMVSNRKRKLNSCQLYYDDFGDPLRVIEMRKQAVPMEIKGSKVLVRMIASPVSTTDLNIIQGSAPVRPFLPSVGGEEGVGQVVDKGELVEHLRHGNRVVINSRMRGAWQTYGIYDEKDLHLIPFSLPLPEACMLTVAPSMAFRMLVDYCCPQRGQTVVQNAASSACGQCVIQLCKVWKIRTINIVTETEDYANIKRYLLELGATHVFSDTEAKEGKLKFGAAMQRPVLALNCLGGKDEDLILSLLEENGTAVYYGSAFGLGCEKLYLRPDLKYNKFLLNNWDMCGGTEKGHTLNCIIQMILRGQFKAPLYEWIPFQQFKTALEHTSLNEAYCTTSWLLNMCSVCDK